jgi:hypothetical protein
MNEYWYHLYTLAELPNVSWPLFKQTLIWNLAGTEFILEYKEKPADKTGVLTRDEAAILSKSEDWSPRVPGLDG